MLGITTVAGNVPLELTQRNARMMCDIAGRTDMPVYAGCEKPLVRDAITAEYIHGDTGIDGIDVFEPETPLQAAACRRLHRRNPAQCRNGFSDPGSDRADDKYRGGDTTRPRDSRCRASDIVSMGGAMREGGNRSPSAEFNILVDPHAADIVFRCGRPVTAMGLDVTHQVLSTRERVMRIRNVGNAVADATADMLSFFHRYDTRKYGSEGAPLHDPCTVAWLLRPDLFATKACNLSVETGSALTLGHTAVDFWHVTDRPHNVDWTYEVDAEGFYDLLVEKLTVFGD